MKLTSRQAVMLTAMLGTTNVEELYDVFEELYDSLSPYQSEIALELSSHLINFNQDISELLDDIIEQYKEEPL